MKTIDCTTANQISLVLWLASFGIKPQRISGNSYWYFSPFRKENTPSFKVDVKLNRWFDHGINQGGRMVDLATAMLKVSIPTLLQQLSQQNIGSFSFHEQIIPDAPKFKVRKIKALENKALLDYLSKRDISVSLAKSYCKEIYYEAAGKNYFAIAFKNDSYGFEVRNKYFKACLLKKDITSIIRPDAKKLVMTEGFIDFLSLFKMPSINLDSTSFIVLNSVTQIDKAKTKMVELNPLQIEAFFDNDDAGRRCFESLKQDFPAAIDRSNLYQRFKDLNEMLVKKKERSEEQSL